jgi:hypothetical protein
MGCRSLEALLLEIQYEKMVKTLKDFINSITGTTFTKDSLYRVIQRSECLDKFLRCLSMVHYPLYITIIWVN